MVRVRELVENIAVMPFSSVWKPQGVDKNG